VTTSWGSCQTLESGSHCPRPPLHGIAGTLFHGTREEKGEVIMEVEGKGKVRGEKR